MINKRIRNGQELEDALSLADRYLDTESDSVRPLRAQGLGFN